MWDNDWMDNNILLDISLSLSLSLSGCVCACARAYVCVFLKPYSHWPLDTLIRTNEDGLAKPRGHSPSVRLTVTGEWLLRRGGWGWARTTGHQLQVSITVFIQ